MKTIFNYLKLMRIKHYIKNLLIFIPLFFSGNIFSISLLSRAALAFLTFSLVSSIVYIINDIKDAEKDRLHSKKKNRPIAAGKISVKAASFFMAVLLLIFVALLCFFVLKKAYYVCAVAVVYLVINLGYSLGLKSVPILDVVILSAGFILRILIGSAATDITISKWLYLTVFAGSFFLALGKRRNEIVQEHENTRNVLGKYTASFLSNNMYMCSGLTIVFYSLWCIDDTTVARIGNDNLILTIPLVIIICLKYSLDTENCSDGDPVEVITKDKFLLALGIVYALVMAFLIGIF